MPALRPGVIADGEAPRMLDVDVGLDQHSGTDLRAEPAQDPALEAIGGRHGVEQDGGLDDHPERPHGERAPRGVSAKVRLAQVYGHRLGFSGAFGG